MYRGTLFGGLTGVFLMVSSLAFAGPFGLEQGQKINTLDVEREISPFHYLLKSVPNPNADFDAYIVIAGKEAGICTIMAAGKTHDHDSFGEDVRSAFLKIKSALEENYGKSGTNDFLKSGAIWKDLGEWVMAIRQNERVYQAYWDKNSRSSLKGGISEILLTVRALSRNESYLHLQYTYENDEKCEAEEAAAVKNSL